MRQTLVVDFDGVIHAYTSGWKGQLEIVDPPVPGAFAWLTQVADQFEVIVFSSRLNPRGRSREAVLEAFRTWFLRHGLPPETLSKLHFWTEPGKPMGILYIDDRGYRFEGRFPDAREILAMKPWQVVTEPD
jgi:hypothetical protein